jgi:hypothetical protein
MTFIEKIKIICNKAHDLIGSLPVSRTSGSPEPEFRSGIVKDITHAHLGPKACCVSESNPETMCKYRAIAGNCFACSNLLADKLALLTNYYE